MNRGDQVFTPIVNNDKTYKKVLMQLQGLIFDGTLKSGDKLPPERQLAATLEVSRPVLKQALSILEAMNVVECRQGDGNYILPLEENLFNPIVLQFYSAHGQSEDILEVRYILEVQAAKLAARRAEPWQLDRLDEIVERMQDWETLEDRIRLNSEFHGAIHRLVGNPLLTALYQSIMKLVEQQIRYTDGIDFYTSHKEIVEALRTGDPEQARESMVKHFTDKFPDYDYYA
ncbi:MAG: FadR family transcriptional regulator [Lachnospiraceae bacterium]|nr:FadR family transcriptional regulator [Lachnospiraceae bacterium]